jgi:ATP-binding cassette subfamily G (WHITE) protein 2 (PDR)
MRSWARWINYVDPIAYGFESVMINEFAGQNYTCEPSALVPAYANVLPLERVCSTIDAVAGSAVVRGEDYITASYQFLPSHK